MANDGGGRVEIHVRGTQNISRHAEGLIGDGWPVDSEQFLELFDCEAGVSIQVSAYLTAVYGWMCTGLAITASTAWLIARSPALASAIAANRLEFWGLMIAQLGIVFVLSARVQRLTASTASLLFVLYSALTGVTISFVLLAFTGESVATTFFVTAGMFGGLAAYGTVTRRSLAGFGQFLFMGLIGVVLASIVGMFWHGAADLRWCGRLNAVRG